LFNSDDKLIKENIYFIERPYFDNEYINNNILVLMTDKGENPVYIDQNGKNHLFTTKELCLLPVIENMNFDNPLSLRIEGQTYTVEELRNIILAYETAIEDKKKCKELFSKMESKRGGFTLGALSFKFI